MDIKEKILNITQKPAFIPTVVGTTAFVVGGGIGYILGKRNAQEIITVVNNKPEQLSLLDYVNEQELPMDDSGKVVLNVVQDIQDVPESTEANNKIDYSKIATSASKKSEDEEPPIINVFRANNTRSEAWDFDAEVAGRDPSKPYIIHEEEYIRDEMGFRQETVTYYEGDDIMADPLDTAIHNYKGIMGELRFGHGSNDPNIVYIRNENLNVEWEVLRHSGSFATEVMGLEYERAVEDEIRHSNVVRKFRPD